MPVTASDADTGLPLSVFQSWSAQLQLQLSFASVHHSLCKSIAGICPTCSFLQQLCRLAAHTHRLGVVCTQGQASTRSACMHAPAAPQCWAFDVRELVAPSTCNIHAVRACADRCAVNLYVSSWSPGQLVYLSCQGPGEKDQGCLPAWSKSVPKKEAVQGQLSHSSSSSTSMMQENREAQLSRMRHAVGKRQQEVCCSVQQ
jgi:hypothetical protein